MQSNYMPGIQVVQVVLGNHPLSLLWQWPAIYLNLNEYINLQTAKKYIIEQERRNNNNT